MRFGAGRSLPILVLSTAFSISLPAQTPPGKTLPLRRVEPGLEEAVKWEWRVAPSDEKNWGLPTPTPTPTPSATPTPVVQATPEIRPTLYEVKHGDALVLIGKKFGMTVLQIQTFNGLKGDKIRVGQTLKIPTLAELKAMAPPPPKPKAAGTPGSKLSPEVASDLDKLRLEIFLDREQFSAGPIVGYPPPDFERVVLVYQSTHDDAKDDASLGAKALTAVPNVFTHYKLRAEDFRFIAPPRPDTVVPKPSPPPSFHGRPGKSPARSPVAAGAVPLTYQQLTEQSMLPYRSPWEFVEERFHCQESYLHALNSKLPTTPGIGADFQVPDVVPFEIEKAFDEPLQPQADPKNPVTAAVIGLSQLNIYQSGALIAVLPLSPARPGLHGRNIWTILDVIPRPRLATFQKDRVERTLKPGFPNGSTSQEPVGPAAAMALPSEQYLAAGPRNPVGILWINLAKSKSTDPLPYGLHGTSIPDKMKTEQSLGGFRLANWDIARAVRHLPPGTPLEWK